MGEATYREPHWEDRVHASRRYKSCLKFILLPPPPPVHYSIGDLTLEWRPHYGKNLYDPLTGAVGRLGWYAMLLLESFSMP